MFEVASQIIICLILAALIGGIIGYLIGRASCSERTTCNEGEKGSHELHIDQQENNTTEVVSLLDTKDVGEKPTLLTEPRKGGKDNLQLIKGVGKVLEGVLNETGIYHFDQIANLTKEEISWLDNSMSFPGRIEREEWVAQAKLLAKGETTEFAQRVERGEVSSSKKSN
jgi:predicted flap endonuclease-1-like 5' DNA nuclease